MEKTMEKTMENVLEERYALVLSHFEENFLEFIFEEHSYVEQIIFYGSYMKGLNHGLSDIDIICVPKATFFEELDEDEYTFSYLLAIHEDFTSSLVKQIPLDIKLRTLQEEGSQIGISYHSNDMICGTYGFDKGMIGHCAVLDKNLSMTFQSL